MDRMLVVFLLLAAMPVSAQQVRAQGPKSQPRVIAAPAQPYNSMSDSTTPFDCQQYRRHPHPGMKPFCEGVEANTLQAEARRQGRPGPSTEVIDLPALGSPGAKANGVACVGGQAMRKIEGGWEQVHSPYGGWQRCRGG
jgi:hypothetical protein